MKISMNDLNEVVVIERMLSRVEVMKMTEMRSLLGRRFKVSVLLAESDLQASIPSKIMNGYRNVTLSKINSIRLTETLGFQTDEIDIDASRH